MSEHGVNVSRRTAVLAVFLLSLMVQGTSCPDSDQAKRQSRAAVVSSLQALDGLPPNWRVHWKILKKKTEVSSFDFLGTGGLQSYVCGGWCAVFFVDLNPLAHFAHPTRIIVYDSDPEYGGPFHMLENTVWWPTIREQGWSRFVSIFNTVAAREDPSHIFIVGGFPGEMALPEPSEGPTIRFVAAPGSGHGTAPGLSRPTPTPTSQTLVGVDECDAETLPVWAILVNGYHDTKNTFDEDVSGMYAVLRGLGVDNGRIQLLSPMEIEGVPDWKVASPGAVGAAFSQTKTEMAICAESPAEIEPHFVLFWSSHGMAGALACNQADGSGQDPVWDFELNDWIESLEAIWKASGKNELSTTILIEACESGLIGETLKGTNSDQRWIFTSAKGTGSVSCGDVDENIAGKDDPNPADIGSETIWGYLEAYGTVSAHGDGDGKISFEEAVQYAKDSDVGFVDGAVPIEHTCRHESMSWMPAAPDPMVVHGAWNTSPRAPASVNFSALSSTYLASSGGVLTNDVFPGEIVKLEIEISNVGGSSEVGALAFRLFRNDENAPGNQWVPIYYENDSNRTTFMIEGLSANQTVALEYTLEIPQSMQEGESMRLIVDLDSAQLAPTAGASVMVGDSRTSEIILKVGKKCKSLCCWWRDLWD